MNPSPPASAILSGMRTRSIRPFGPWPSFMQCFIADYGRVRAHAPVRITWHLVFPLILAAPQGLFVRSADAVHLTTAQEAGEREVWTNDRHMLAAAAYFGLSGQSV